MDGEEKGDRECRNNNSAGTKKKAKTEKGTSEGVGQRGREYKEDVGGAKGKSAGSSSKMESKGATKATNRCTTKKLEGEERKELRRCFS